MTDLEFALEHSRRKGSGNFPDVMPLDFGLDFHLDSMPELYAEVNSYGKSEKRQVKLVISTFRGMCWEAVHYYGKLRADGVHIIQETEENGKTLKHCLGGYICEEYSNMLDKYVYDCFYDFEILRPVTQEEIDADPDRWYGYEPGWTTNAFETKEEIIKIAKKVAAVRFPGWEFVIEND